jgi:ribonuclease BN (tRNA processing enzyme)
VVGCSGSVPGPASPASCYLIEADDAEGRTWRVVLDLGSGALGALQRYCDPRDIDAVALSHLHLDHCADVASLHTYLSHHPDGRTESTVYGPFGTAGRLEQLRGSTDSSHVLTTIAWQSGRSVDVGPITIYCESVTHSVPAYALRVEGPSELPARERATIAYSGDSDVCAGLARVANGADALICEASFLESDDVPAGIHVTAADAGKLATASGCDRLIVTHLPPWTDPNAALSEVRAHYRGALDVARPGMRVAV